jgi:hypothetical protein
LCQQRRPSTLSALFLGAHNPSVFLPAFPGFFVLSFCQPSLTLFSFLCRDSIYAIALRGLHRLPFILSHLFWLYPGAVYLPDHHPPSHPAVPLPAADSRQLPLRGLPPKVLGCRPWHSSSGALHARRALVSPPVGQPVSQTTSRSVSRSVIRAPSRPAFMQSSSCQPCARQSISRSVSRSVGGSVRASWTRPKNTTEGLRTLPGRC